MKMLVFLLLMNVFQHALAVVVEVNEGAESVLLPCQYSGFIPEDPTVVWTHSDLDPKSVHLHREGGDDLIGQNRPYSGRTSVRPEALDSGDFSLTLRKPQLTDSSTYTCSISDGREELRLRDIQLQVKDQHVEVKVKERSESVILPCKTKPGLPKDTTVEWTHSDPELMIVHMYANRGDHIQKQDGLYRDRTKVAEDLLRTGDLSLTLKQPTQRDTGGYICTIYRDNDILRQKILLQVKEPVPSWVTALVVLLTLPVLLVVLAVLIFNCCYSFMSVPQVEVESGVESVQLPCKTTLHLPKDAKVEWRDRDNRKIHVYQNGSDRSDEQDWLFKQRTEMNEDLLKTGDLSLTVKYPIQWNRDICTCIVYSSEGCILLKKQVKLKVKDCQVEVEEGAESVQLCFKTTGDLPGDTKVKWRRIEPKTLMNIHVYQNASDQYDEQNQDYTGRTKMTEDPLRTGDLSLTLKKPTERDSGRYRCEADRKESNIWREKTVLLRVKGRAQVHNQTEDIRNRSSSTDPTLMMADQSV